jgi:hypothetical protein
VLACVAPDSISALTPRSDKLGLPRTPAGVFPYAKGASVEPGQTLSGCKTME